VLQVPRSPLLYRTIGAEFRSVRLQPWLCEVINNAGAKPLEGAQFERMRACHDCAMVTGTFRSLANIYAKYDEYITTSAACHRSRNPFGPKYARMTGQRYISLSTPVREGASYFGEQPFLSRKCGEGSENHRGSQPLIDQRLLEVLISLYLGMKGLNIRSSLSLPRKRGTIMAFWHFPLNFTGAVARLDY